MRYRDWDFMREGVTAEMEVAEAMAVAGWAEIFGIRWLLKSKTLQKLQKPSPFHTSFSLFLSVCVYVLFEFNK